MPLEAREGREVVSFLRVNTNIFPVDDDCLGMISGDFEVQVTYDGARDFLIVSGAEANVRSCVHHIKGKIRERQNMAVWGRLRHEKGDLALRNQATMPIPGLGYTLNVEPCSILQVVLKEGFGELDLEGEAARWSEVARPCEMHWESESATRSELPAKSNAGKEGEVATRNEIDAESEPCRSFSSAMWIRPEAKRVTAIIEAYKKQQIQSLRPFFMNSSEKATTLEAKKELENREEKQRDVTEVMTGCGRKGLGKGRRGRKCRKGRKMGKKCNKKIEKKWTEEWRRECSEEGVGRRLRKDVKGRKRLGEEVEDKGKDKRRAKEETEKDDWMEEVEMMDTSE